MTVANLQLRQLLPSWKSVSVCLQSYPSSEATVKICGVVVAEDHLEAFLRHRLDGEVGGVGGVCPQLDRVLVPGEIIDNDFGVF